jgi:hypothetical protein
MHMNNICLSYQALTRSLQGLSGGYVCLDMKKLIAFLSVAVLAPVVAALVAAMTIAVVLS